MRFESLSGEKKGNMSLKVSNKSTAMRVFMIKHLMITRVSVEINTLHINNTMLKC